MDHAADVTFINSQSVRTCRAEYCVYVAEKPLFRRLSFGFCQSGMVVADIRVV